MPETHHAHRRRHASSEPDVFPAEHRPFMWVARNRFDLWSAYVREAREGEAARDDEGARFREAIEQAKRWMLARLVVTILLSLGVVATAFSTIAGFVPEVGGLLQMAEGAMRTLAAWAASITVVLVAARMVIQRILARYDVSAAFLSSRAVLP